MGYLVTKIAFQAQIIVRKIIFSKALSKIDTST